MIVPAIPYPQKIIVAPESVKKRLDIFLSENLGIRRSQAQKLINQKLIHVNDKLPKKAGGRVKTGDMVSLRGMSAANDEAIPLYSEPNHIHKRVIETKGLPRRRSPPAGGLAPPRNDSVKPGSSSLTLKIISETPDYLVVEKPPGLLTHPTMAEETETLSTLLAQKYPELTTVGDDPARPSIVHRLDKEASGLLVVARTPKMFDHLKQQFKNRTIAKEYLVLVHGRVARDEVTIDFPIARSKTFDRMAARPASKKIAGTHYPPLPEGGSRGGGSEGKSALTEFMVEKRFKNFTLLRVAIHTGRMHQIRAHLLAYNHPVVGDPLYWQKKRPRTWDDQLGRLFLHAHQLSFTDLEGARQTFISPLPKELQNFLTQLRLEK